MFKNILFATTISSVCEDAANIAFDMAKQYQSCLHVFHIVGVPTHGFSQFVIDIETGEKELFNNECEAWVKEEVKNTYSKYLEGYDNCQVECKTGVPSTEILRKARKENVDLIIMGAHLPHEDADALRYRNIIGGTMQQVAKSARCPVLIVSRPYEKDFWNFKNIVFGTDFSKASYSAFQYALQVAKETGSKLHLFHAVNIEDMEMGRPHSQFELEAKIAKAEERMSKAYIPSMKGFDNYEIEIWEGIPYIEILKYSREKEADLIVMAHHTSRNSPKSSLIGSTTEQVVLRSACPVASVNRPTKSLN